MAHSFQDGSYPLSNVLTLKEIAIFFNQYESKMIALIDSFLSRNISASDFEVSYLKEWRCYRDADNVKKSDENTQRYFDSVFSAVDTYCSDPELIDAGDLTEKELLEEVARLKLQSGNLIT